MTTDTTALQERIAEALAEHWRRKHSTLLTSGPCSGCSRVAAAAVLPIVAVEVRKAKAEAWDEAYGLGVADAHTSVDWTGGEIPPGRVNPHRPYPWKIGETDG